MFTVSPTPFNAGYNYISIVLFIFNNVARFVAGGQKTFQSICSFGYDLRMIFLLKIR